MVEAIGNCIKSRTKMHLHSTSGKTVLCRKGYATVYFKTAAFLAVLFCLSCATIGWASPSESVADNTRAAAPVSQGPLIRAEIASLSQFNYAQALNVEMTVENYGDAAARDVNIYCRQNPTGYFYLTVPDQPSVAIDITRQKVSLGNMTPGDWKIIHFSIHAPLASQIKGEWSHKFYFEFTYSYDGMDEAKLANVVLSTKPGKILVDKGAIVR